MHDFHTGLARGVEQSPVDLDHRCGSGKVEPGEIVPTVPNPVLAMTPGRVSKMLVNVERRKGFAGRVPLEVKGLPHGARVLNIGLNGILVTERDTSREIVIYAEPWVRPTEHPIALL